MKRRNGMNLVLGVVVCTSVSSLPAPSLSAQEETAASEGMITYASNADFAATLARVEPAVTARGLFLMRVLDHASAAAQFGQTMSSNSVVLFGNPKVGSQIMQCAPKVGIDLPQKLLVWEEGGTVFVAYNDPNYLIRRHSIAGCDELLARVAENLDQIARTVAGKTEP